MKKTLLLSLIVLMNLITVNAQLTESFDGTTFPPAGWLNLHSSGTDPTAVWERAVAGAFGGDINATTTFDVDPHSGAGMASFRAWDFASGNGAYLITSAVNLSTGGPHLVSFWMHRDNTYNTQDSISVYINTTQSATGASFLGKVLRKRSLPPNEPRPDGWYQYSFNIPAGFNSEANYFIFNAVGRFGNNLFIDDVAVSAQPACSAPTGITAAGFSYAEGTATASWAASPSGTVLGYQWAVNTTGTDPASGGTLVEATSANITGITANVVNYIYVRTSCGSGSFSSWASFAFAALPCATLTAPGNAATNVPQNQSFTWAAVTGATSYDVYLGTTAGNAVNIGNLTGTATPIGNLSPEQTYYWFVVPSLNSVPALSSTCTPASFTIAAETNNPVNNTCAGAIAINTTNITGNPVNGTTINATLTLPANSCGTGSGTADDDVWFEFTTTAAPPAGTITISPLASGGISDIVAEVYAAGSCTSLGAPVTCSDATTDTDPEQVNLALLAPATHYFMRVYSYSSTVGARGGFTIVVSAGNTLPVTVVAFTARRTNGVNMLNWSTQQELNTRYFVVERSNDGRNYAGIGQVAAAGNSNTLRNYSFTDNHPVRGINYYRLRTVDKDNIFKLSDTRSIRNEGIADITLYPNPVKGRLGIDINADKAASGQIVITDLGGKIVYRASVKIGQGNTLVPVGVQALAAGTYIVKIQLNDDQVIRKFSKQ